MQLISQKYETAQQEIRKHTLAMDKLLDLWKYNNDRFDTCKRSMSSTPVRVIDHDFKNTSLAQI